MLKVISSIVDEKLNVIGLTIEGKGVEFGDLSAGTEKVHRSYYLNDLAKLGFKTALLSVVNDNGRAKIVYNNKTNDRLRNLPMQMLTKDGLVPFSNKGEILAIKYNGNTNAVNTIGYSVKIGNKQFDVKRNDILALSEIVDLNFRVAVGNDGVPYIVGKPGGIKKEDLKAEIVNLANPVKKAGRDTAGPTVKTDVVRLFDMVDNLGGLILVNTGNKHMGEMIVKTSAIVKPKLKYTAKNLNMNITGVLYGNVVVNDKAYPVKAYRTVNVVSNGKLNVSEITVVLKKDAFNSFIGEVNGAISFVDTTNALGTADIECIKRTLGEEYIALKLDTSEIDVLTSDHARELILPVKKVDQLVESMYTAKMCKTLINDKSGALILLSELQGVKNPASKEKTMSAVKELIESGMLNKSDVHETFKNESVETLKELLKAGVNICSGFYEPTSYRSDKESTAIEIEYSDKYAKLGSFAKINEALLKQDMTYIPQGVRDFIAILAVNRDTNAMYEQLKKYEKIVDDTVRTLALHKMAMCVLSGFTAVHSMDTDSWELSTKYRGQGNKYMAKGSETELTVVCKNIIIK